MKDWLTQQDVAIRVGPASVTADLSHGRDVRRATVDVGGDPPATALSTCLDCLFPGIPRTAPRVTLALSDALARSSVLRFDALPRRAADRQLIIAQRFCRDHKIDAKQTAIAFSVHATPGTVRVLATAIPRDLVTAITATLSSHGLYADIIAADVALAHVSVPHARTSRSSVLAVTTETGATLLLRDATGTPLNIATLSGNEPGALADRLNARVDRYAHHLGVAPTIPVHVHDPVNIGLSAAVARLRAPDGSEMVA